MRRIIWTDEAIANLEAIAVYIEEFNPLAAQRMALRLVSAAESLAELPDRGRSVGDGKRDLVVITPYVIRYRADEEKIVIIRIRHGARLPE